MSYLTLSIVPNLFDFGQMELEEILEDAGITFSKLDESNNIWESCEVPDEDSLRSIDKYFMTHFVWYLP